MTPSWTHFKPPGCRTVFAPLGPDPGECLICQKNNKTTRFCLSRTAGYSKKLSSSLSQGWEVYSWIPLPLASLMPVTLLSKWPTSPSVPLTCPVVRCQLARLGGGNILPHRMFSSRLGTLDINQKALCSPVWVWTLKCQKSRPVSLKWEQLLFGEPRVGSILACREVGAVGVLIDYLVPSP